MNLNKQAEIRKSSTSKSKKSRIDDKILNFNKIMPEEIKQLIFEYMNFNDLMNASLVCQEWNTIIADSMTLTSKMIYTYQDRRIAESQTDIISPQLTRKYINFKFLQLPSDVEFQEKFGHMRTFVKSIILYVNAEFFVVRRFLESFPNLNELELSTCFVSLIFLTDQDIPKMDLKSIQHFKISSNSYRFARTALELISQDVQLVSFCLTRGADWIEFEDDLLHFGRMSESLCQFLNGQINLKCLELSAVGRLFQGSGIALEPRFQLTELKMQIFAQAIDGNDDINFQRLLQTCVTTCQSLSLHLNHRSQLQIFSEAFIDFEKLDTLKVIYNFCHHNNILSSALSRRTMKSQLRNLAVRFIVSDVDRAALSLFIAQQRNSLESLTVNIQISCNDPFWESLGQVAKLKILRIPRMVKTALKRIQKSSLESLVTTNDARIESADETFWNNFRSKHPNFKSINYEPYSYFDFDYF